MHKKVYSKQNRKIYDRMSSIALYDACFFKNNKLVPKFA